ncbi:Uncharacterised protein [Vibrio cholerae]|nr:Uncharacterised protein [Vibrio cholerae]
MRAQKATTSLSLKLAVLSVISNHCHLWKRSVSSRSKWAVSTLCSCI